ncbi:MAG TPA: phage holin family protein [Thermoleophilaceae bacterium]|nr:phage holin family protein [Thermoleophilaceae bacterium]
MSAPPPNSDKSVGEIVSEVSEKASLLVREEIALAKAEVAGKVKTLGKGAGVAAAAGVFLFFAFIFFLEALAWFFNDLLNVVTAIWLGFLIVFLILVALAVIAGLLAKKWLSSGPPTPDMAIEEAKATRDQFEHQTIERDQVTRSLERDKETTEP